MLFKIQLVDCENFPQGAGTPGTEKDTALSKLAGGERVIVSGKQSAVVQSSNHADKTILTPLIFTKCYKLVLMPK
jgi:hypothetical protein